MPKPILSVIMIVQNSQEFLNPAIDSVLRQTVKDLELIVIDNGSEDNTRHIIANYQDKRMSYHRIDKSDPSVALSKGLELAECAFVALVGAYDAIFPKCMKTQLEFLINNKKIDVVTSNMFVMDKDNLPVTVQTNLSRPNQLRLQFLLDIQVEMHNIMLRRSACDTLKKMVDSQPYNERLLLWLLSEQYPIYNHSKLLYAKRDVSHPDMVQEYGNEIENKIWEGARQPLTRQVIKEELGVYSDQDPEVAKPYLSLLAATIMASKSHRKIFLLVSILLNVMTIKGYRTILKELLRNPNINQPEKILAHPALEEDFV